MSNEQELLQLIEERPELLPLALELVIQEWEKMQKCDTEER